MSSMDASGRASGSGTAAGAGIAMAAAIKIAKIGLKRIATITFLLASERHRRGGSFAENYLSVSKYGSI